MSRYFANGTEGYAWMDEWCHRCGNDHGFSHVDWSKMTAQDWPESEGCPIIARAFFCGEDVVPEWVDHSDTEGFTMPPAVHCLMFTPCQKCNPGDDGDDGPRRPKPGPGQLALFDMAEHSLMWKGAAQDYLAQFPSVVDVQVGGRL